MLMYFGGFLIMFIEFAILIALAIYSVPILRKLKYKTRKHGISFLLSYLLMILFTWLYNVISNSADGLNTLLILVAIFLLISLIGIFLAKKKNAIAAFIGSVFCWMTVLGCFYLFLGYVMFD